MGYCYERNRNGSSGRLCCDSCGDAGGVRKRTCPHKVHYGDGTALPYCPAPALCEACWEKHGKNKIHAECKDRAAASTAEEAARQRRHDAGDHEVKSRWGSWHEAVPKGLVGASFINNKTGERVWLLLGAPWDEAHWLEEIPVDQQTVWVDHPGATKEVTA